MDEAQPSTRPITITAGGKDLTIAPLGIRKLGRVAKALKPIADSDVADMPTILADFHENIIAAIVAATGEPDEWVANLAPSDLARLALTVIRINTESLAQLAPLLAGEVEAFLAGIGGGLTSPSTSTAPASPTPAH